MIQATSSESYAKLKHIGHDQRIVYNLLMERGAMSNNEIVSALKWKVSSVTPRVCELRDKGFLTGAGKKWDKDTKRNVMTWKVVTHPPLDIEVKKQALLAESFGDRKNDTLFSFAL